jgi:hypothetical protein
MNLSDDMAASIATILGTTQHSFPQTYLGLPLSLTKLPSPLCIPIVTRSL